MSKKILELDTEKEQSLVAVFDAALKASGVSVLHHIDKLRTSVVVKEDERLEK